MTLRINAADFSDELLQYLYVSARLGTMRAAADALGVAPSSVSRQIAKVERYLGVSLVEKGSHRVRLTAAGQLVVEHYRERRAQKEALLARLDDLKGIRAGHYTLAVGEGFISTVLLSTLQAFSREYPGVRLEIVTAATPDVLTMVCEDFAHLGFVFDHAPDPRVRVKLTIPQPLKAIVAPTHALSTRESVTLADLVGYPLILPRETFRIREVLKAAEREEGISLDPMISTNSLLLMRDCARGGIGVAIMSELSIAEELDARRLVSVTIENSLARRTNAEVITRLGRQLPSGAEAILKGVASALARWIETHPAASTSATNRATRSADHPADSGAAGL